MTDRDIFNNIKTSLAKELDEIADKEIEDLCHKFKENLRNHKAEFITALISNVEMVATQNNITREMVFQINIKGVNEKL